MKYQEMLDLCEQNKIYGSQVYIAEEMECQLHDCEEIEYTPERFEELCALAHNCYLKDDQVTILAICVAVAKLERRYLSGDGQNPIEMSKWDILNEAAFCQ